MGWKEGKCCSLEDLDGMSYFQSRDSDSEISAHAKRQENEDNKEAVATAGFDPASSGL